VEDVAPDLGGVWAFLAVAATRGAVDLRTSSSAVQSPGSMSDAEARFGGVAGVETFAPGSDGYKRATSPRNSSAIQQPLLVAVPASIAELAAAVRYAATHELRVVPQATGHGAGVELGDDVMLLDTSRLTSMEIDRERRTARVGAGAQWGAINLEAEKFGLLGRAGSAPDVAVCGFTFGGGAGWLTRPHGLAAGALTAVDYVDGFGNVRRASDDASAEVDRAAMWAYRGGGGVGVAGTLEFDLVAVDDLWAGSMLWPIDELAGVVSAWSDAIARVGPALATSIGVLRVPPGPPIPGTQPGQQVVHLALASSDGAGHAVALRDALAALSAPLVDSWGRSDAAKLGEIHLDPPVAVPALGTARWLDSSASSIAFEVLAAAVDSPILMIELRHVANAAIARDGAASIVAADFMLHAVGDVGDPDSRPALEAAFAVVRQVAGAADTGLAVGSWAEGRAAVPDALPPAVRDRVVAITKMVDPNGVIAPSRFIAETNPQSLE
jgi:FAD binding domain